MEDDLIITSIFHNSSDSCDSDQEINSGDVEIKSDVYYRPYPILNSDLTCVELKLIKNHHSLWGEFIYNAARVLSDIIEESIYLANTPDSSRLLSNLDNSKVLELGAGAGLPGIIATLNGCKEVILTDYGHDSDDSLIQALRLNIEYVKSFIDASKQSISCYPYVFGNDIKTILGPNNDDLFDYILCADLLFNRSEHRKLLYTLSCCLKKPYDMEKL